MMRRGKNNKLTAVLALSLALGTYGMVDAAGIDATATVTTSGGPYNSIKVSSGRQGDSYIYGVYSSSATPLSITLEGDKLIEITDTGLTDANDKRAHGTAVLGADITGDGIQVKVTATGGTITNNNTESGTKAEAKGISAKQITNTLANDISITAVGVGGNINTTFSDDTVAAYMENGADVTGVYAENGTNNMGSNISVTTKSTGGNVTSLNAKADAHSYAGASVENISAHGGINNVGNNLQIDAMATGGTVEITSSTTRTFTDAFAYSYAGAEANGVYNEYGTNNLGK